MTTEAPPLISTTDWYVTRSPNSTTSEIHIVLTSDEEVRAWATWLCDHAGKEEIGDG